MDPQWIIAIATSLLVVGVGIAVWQIQAEHEKCRREKAIDLLMHFDQCLDKETSIARKLVDKLGETQIRSIFNQESLQIDASLKEYAEGSLGNRYTLSVVNSKIDIDSKQSSEIRWAAIKYLNLLETILSAWLHNVADKDIIREQLRYIYNPQNNEYALTKFRTVAGGKANFPAFDAFVKELENEFNKPAKGKKKVA